MQEKIIKSILLIFGLFVSFSFCNADGIYRNQSDGIISIVVNGTTKYTIQDKNVGATTVFSQSYSENTCGNYFQRGNNYGFPFYGYFNRSSNRVDTSNYGPGNYYSSNVFIMSSSNWSSNDNPNLRGNTTNTDEARRGPCDEGFHIPSSSEIQDFSSLYQSLGLSSSSYFSYLKFGLCGYIHNSQGSVVNQGTFGFYRSSTPLDSSRAIDIALNYGNSYVESYNDGKAYGVSIRGFKNTVVDPTSSRTVLYGDPIEDPTPNNPVFKVNYGGTYYEYNIIDSSNVEIYLKSPVEQNGNTFSYVGSTGLNLYYNGTSQRYDKDKLYLYTPSWYSNNIFTPVCL